MVLFSVVVPVYNAAHTIERCVNSIVKSGGDDVQIILVEDFSKDNSWSVCQELEKRFNNVYCIRNSRNRGVSYTRNHGLEQAQGQYVLFVDSDDWVDEKYVSTFRRVLLQGDVFAICGYVNHDEKHSGRTDVVAWNDFKDEKQVPMQTELQKLYDSCLLQQLWNKVFVNRIIQENHIRFDESISIGEDTRFILEYLEKAQLEYICLINQALYHYMRDQDGSLMFRVGYESVEEPLKNLRKLYELINVPEEQIVASIQEQRQKLITSYAYLIMHNAGMPQKEKKRLILALDQQNGRKLYRRNRLLFLKEQLAKILK